MTTRTKRLLWLKFAAGLLFAVVTYGGAYNAMGTHVVTFAHEAGYLTAHHRSFSSETLAAFFVPMAWIESKYAYRYVVLESPTHCCKFRPGIWR